MNNYYECSKPEYAPFSIASMILEAATNKVWPPEVSATNEVDLEKLSGPVSKEQIGLVLSDKQIPYRVCLLPCALAVASPQDVFVVRYMPCLLEMEEYVPAYEGWRTRLALLHGVNHKAGTLFLSDPRRRSLMKAAEDLRFPKKDIIDALVWDSYGLKVNLTQVRRSIECGDQ